MRNCVVFAILSSRAFENRFRAFITIPIEIHQLPTTGGMFVQLLGKFVSVEVAFQAHFFGGLVSLLRLDIDDKIFPFLHGGSPSCGCVFDSFTEYSRDRLTRKTN